MYAGVTWHGAYKREELTPLLAGISPSYAVLCSIWPETYSHTLTEAWMMGLPVIASNLGATAERIRRHGGGFLVDPESPDAWLEALEEVRDLETWCRMRADVRRIVFRSTAEMGREYERLYCQLLDR